MDKAFEVNEKLMIITIIIGFIFGFYLAIGHDNPNLWTTVIQWALLTAIIMTLIPVVAGVHNHVRYGAKMSALDAVRIFALNFAVVAVCISFGFVLGSLLIGNYSTAN